jgi:MFS family permease
MSSTPAFVAIPMMAAPVTTHNSPIASIRKKNEDDAEESRDSIVSLSISYAGMKADAKDFDADVVGCGMCDVAVAISPDAAPVAGSTWMSGRWTILVVVGFIIFSNHYTRDVVGTLEKQIESDFPMSTSTYALINSMYFGPNIVSPLFAGIAIKFFGQPWKCLFVVCLLAAIGHTLFALGYYLRSIHCVYFGRTVAGVMYEIIDTMPVILLKPLFGDNWSAAMGIMNSFLRLGSVSCFVVSPFIYRTLGDVAVALGFAAVVGWAGCACSLSGWLTENNQAPLTTNAGASQPYDLNSVEYTAVTRDEVNDSQEIEAGLEFANENDDNAILELANIHERRQAIHRQKKVASLSPTVTRSAESFMSRLKLLIPLHELPPVFYFYILAASLMYGSMVPFWFMGSKYLQSTYTISVSKADSYMLIPELQMVVFSWIFGLLMDKYSSSARTRMIGFAAFSALLAFAYWMLLEFNHELSPVVCMLLLGTGFTVAHDLVWFSLTLISPSKHFEFCSGFICSAINVFPALIPPLVVYVCEHLLGVYAEEQRMALVWVLCLMAFGASCSALAASFCAKPNVMAA